MISGGNDGDEWSSPRTVTLQGDEDGIGGEARTVSGCISVGVGD